MPQRRPPIPEPARPRQMAPGLAAALTLVWFLALAPGWAVADVNPGSLLIDSGIPSLINGAGGDLGFAAATSEPFSRPPPSPPTQSPDFFEWSRVTDTGQIRIHTQTHVGSFVPEPGFSLGRSVCAAGIAGRRSRRRSASGSPSAPRHKELSDAP